MSGVAGGYVCGKYLPEIKQTEQIKQEREDNGLSALRLPFPAQL